MFGQVLGEHLCGVRLGTPQPNMLAGGVASASAGEVGIVREQHSLPVGGVDGKHVVGSVMQARCGG